MTTSGPLARLQEIVEAALERPATQWEAFVSGECGGDSKLRDQALDLLRRSSSAEGFLEAPPAALLPFPKAKIGEIVGGFRLEAQVGAGGMADVYRAVRVGGDFHQVVAVKLLKRGMESAEALRRFEGERRILAGLKDPNIAQLIDGGETEDHQPFLVMEFVEGEPIDDHCRRRNLSIRERVRLFLSVCSAVRRAHRSLVIHRDLKPANILVDRSGVPKLLDFGIAKLLDPEPGQEVTTLAPPRTPRYASPEQVRGESMSTATDIYSLGVVLYELLTGLHPHAGLRGRALDLAIQEDEPRAPSAAALTQPSAAAQAPAGREVRARAKELRGDLDNILRRALEKDPERRFGSVEALAEDLERFLEERPVLSRGASLSYRSWKFVRRHRVGVIAGGAIAATLIIGISSFLYQQGRIVLQAQEIARQRGRAEEVTEFLISFLQVPDAEVPGARERTVREALDVAAAQFDALGPTEPLTRAALADAMGRVYRSLGSFDRARRFLREALELRRRSLGGGELPVAASLHNLATLERAAGSPMGEVEALLLEARRIYEGKPGERDDADYGALLNDLASLRRLSIRLGWRQAEQAVLEERAGEASAGLGESSAAPAPQVLRLLFEQQEEVLAEAETLARRGLALKRAAGDSELGVSHSLNTLATILKERGRIVEAQRLYEKVLEIRTRRAPGTGAMARALNNLGTIYLDHRDDAAEAKVLFLASLEIRRQLYGSGHRQVAAALNNLALAQGLSREPEKGLEAVAEGLEILRQTSRGGSTLAGALLKTRAILEDLTGDAGACRRTMAEALIILRARSRLSSLEDGRSIDAGCRAGLGEVDEAEPALLESLRILVALQGRDRRTSRQAYERAARVLGKQVAGEAALQGEKAGGGAGAPPPATGLKAGPPSAVREPPPIPERG